MRPLAGYDKNEQEIHEPPASRLFWLQYPSRRMYTVRKPVLPDIATRANMKILFEDKELLVCFKEAGLAVQTADLRTKDLQSMLLAYLRDKQADARANAGAPYLGVIHRLDQPVQGLVVFALSERAAAELSRQSRDGIMKKEYLAIVSARDGRKDLQRQTPSWVTLVDHLLKDSKSRQARVVKEGTKGAKKAVLRYMDVTLQDELQPVLDSFFDLYERGGDEKSSTVLNGRVQGPADSKQDVRLLRIKLETGRYHQIRAQLSHAGMPIIGDRRYGRADLVQDLRFPALCAYRLDFSHPVTGRKMHFELMPEQIRFR